MTSRLALAATLGVLALQTGGAPAPGQPKQMGAPSQVQQAR
jgi:hypothetical protein